MSRTTQDPLTAFIHIRVDKRTEELIYDACKRYRIKPSEYLRRMIVIRLNRRFTWEPEIVEKRKNSKKEKIFHIRVNDDTKQKLKKKCEILNMDESDYIDFVIQHRLDMYLEHRKRDEIYGNQ